MILTSLTLKLFINLFVSNVWAFPEMVTHGYGNCISCHSSSTGGGLLTPYGRALSKELLSAKSTGPTEKGSEQFLRNWYTPPKNLNIGGDIRFMQMFLDNQFETSGRGLLMQADLEAQYTVTPKIRILATAGRQEISNAKKITDSFISRRHWINFLIGADDNLEKYQLRIGKFFPAYGLNIPEHTTVTRKGLGFDQNKESYNVEYSYLGEDWNLYLTLIEGRPDKKELDREEGGAIQASYIFKNNSKFGFNLYTGNGSNHPSTDRRAMGGAFAIFSLRPKLYTLVEIDRSSSPKKSYGIFEYAKIGYEYLQGLHFYVSAEYEKPSILKFNNSLDAINIGVQYFPATHWEINSYIRRENNNLITPTKNNILMFLLHYYL